MSCLKRSNIAGEANMGITPFEEIGENLSRLREITTVLVSNDCGKVEYSGINGNAIGECLLYNDKVSVQKAFFPEGMEFPEHIHSPSIEWVIVISGIMRGKTGDDVRDYHIGEFQFIPALTPHQHWAVTDVEVIAVTIPAEEAYPNARTNFAGMERLRTTCPTHVG